MTAPPRNPVAPDSPALPAGPFRLARICYRLSYLVDSAAQGLRETVLELHAESVVQADERDALRAAADAMQEAELALLRARERCRALLERRAKKGGAL